MFKQLLTFALAGVLVLETPATAYAAGQSMNIAVADDPAVSYETTAGEAGDVSNGVSDAEKSGGGLFR